MRERKEIEKSNKCQFIAEGKIISEDNYTRPGETLILEVLLDIRELLEKND